MGKWAGAVAWAGWGLLVLPVFLVREAPAGEGGQHTVLQVELGLRRPEGQAPCLSGLERPQDRKEAVPFPSVGREGPLAPEPEEDSTFAV